MRSLSLALCLLFSVSCLGVVPAAGADPVPPLELLGEQVAPGSKKRLALVAGRSFAGSNLEIVRRVMREVDPRVWRL